MLVGALQSAAPALANEPILHVVLQGDSLSELAQTYHVSVQEIRSWNGLQGDMIRLGHPLIVGHRSAEAAGASAASNDDRSASRREYVVEQADTLGCIAERLGVTVEQLTAWNEGLDPDRIEIGQRLAVAGSDPAEPAANGGDDEGRRPTTYRVRSGDTVCAIAARHRMTFDQIRELNPDLELDRIIAGQPLTVLTLGPPSESVGSTTCGRLLHGRRLPPHPGYVLRDPERSWATVETIEQIHAAFDAVAREHPSATRARVHDLSLEGGGPIDDHRSHQSGRDVDITYFQRRCPGDGCPLEPVLPRHMDLGPQWTLMEHWLRSGVVQIMFVDYGLQEVLYNYARRHGATANELAAWFQYPRGRDVPVGLVRHFPNHFDHIHVRFTCPEGNGSCR